MKIASFLFVVLCLTLSNAQTFQLVKHEILSEVNGPRCLDGSPAALYIDIGKQNDNFVIFF